MDTRKALTILGWVGAAAVVAGACWKLGQQLTRAAQQCQLDKEALRTWEDEGGAPRPTAKGGAAGNARFGRASAN